MRLFALLCLPSLALANPMVTHSGRMLNSSGVPLNGAFDLTIELVDAADDVQFAETHSLSLQDGYYSVLLGGQSLLDPADLLVPLDVVLRTGATELGRQPLSAVPVSLAVDGSVRVSAAPACSATTEGALSYTGGALMVCDGTSFGAVAAPVVAPRRSYWRGQAATTVARDRLVVNPPTWNGAGFGHIPFQVAETVGEAILTLEGTDIIRASEDGWLHVDYTQDIQCSSTNYATLRFQRYGVGSSTSVAWKSVLSSVAPDEWSSVHGNAVMPISAGEGIGFYVNCSGGSVSAIDATDWSLLTVFWEPRS
ncbi:MAG: hypothetical protein ACJATT_003459 [Myxococcota bacterium]|jgi:hypothetical protein